MKTKTSRPSSTPSNIKTTDLADDTPDIPSSGVDRGCAGDRIAGGERRRPWLADDNTIVINAKHDAELSPMVRAELSVRLTQALDNQLFDTIEHIQRAPSSQHYQALVAVSVGHAVWVHDLYVDQLSEDDLDDYYTASDNSGAVWAQAMAEVPVAYRAIRAVGQQIGPMFIEALSEEGRTLVAKAMSSAAPAALDQVSLPTSKYFRRDDTEPVTEPPGPAGAEVQFTNQMGPFATYLLFATGLPVNVHR